MSKYLDGVSDKYNNRLERLQREPVIYVHIDTTGIGKNDRVTRMSILADDTLAYYQVFNLGADIGKMTRKAVELSGITRDDLQAAPVSFADEKETIRTMLDGKLIICTGKDFMLEFLEREGLVLERDDVIDLRAIVGMMNHTYSRTTMNDVLNTLYGPIVPEYETTQERNFLMYQCATRLKEIVEIA